MNKSIFIDLPFDALKPSKIGSSKESITTGIIQEESCSRSTDDTFMNKSDTVACWILGVSIIIVFIAMIRNK